MLFYVDNNWKKNFIYSKHFFQNQFLVCRGAVFDEYANLSLPWCSIWWVCWPEFAVVQYLMSMLTQKRVSMINEPRKNQKDHSELAPPPSSSIPNPRFSLKLSSAQLFLIKEVFISFQIHIVLLILELGPKLIQFYSLEYSQAPKCPLSSV